ncbi:STAS domain-containing protein [Nucisporomicrobium flavum]|uniref:STAS domain-containing protein n=1 Tax=Nucisporomicrobium flavum TaxID=2785915 RepID=UPI0018F7C2FF|nr:STAS domain-containing protein [Nucisporomicrobium flavum]
MATIKITGTLTGAGGNRWGRLIRDAAERAPRCLVLDLSETPRVDETALVMLLQVHRALECRVGLLVLQAPRPAVRNMFRLGRIDSVLHIEDAV